ncbi:MAG: NCS2 family permease [Candidatus Tritonobacter lacicola]|nr:NCS2 family permease [Candidatus Tritonobacter lacicola]
MLDKFFSLSEKGTNVRTEIVAGITTFMTMAYIIFVQPGVLSGKMFGMDTGMDFYAVMAATCVAAALATLIMGLYANYPIAQAPGMGENFFFVFSVLGAAAALPAVVAGETTAWQVALGVVFVAGVLFLILSLLKVRQVIIDAISPSMKNGIAAGIGLFIAFIGLQNAKVIVANPGTLVHLTDNLINRDVITFIAVLGLTAILFARKIKGSILIGILAGLVLSLAMGWVKFEGIVGRPPSMGPTFLKMDLLHALAWKMWPCIIVFLYMDMFDTIGTLIGVAEQAGLMVDNKLPRAGRALVSDAIGTVAGAAMGTSTVTSFIESATGVEHGGRTGLTSVATAALFLVALFFGPLVGMVANHPAITAPALVLVGAMMMRNVVKIKWLDYTEAIPAFLILIGIPLTYSIADGLAWGFISYPFIKLLSGRGREVSWLMYILAVLFIARYCIKL